MSKEFNKGTIHKEKESTILEKDDYSDQTEKMDSDEEGSTNRINETDDDLEVQSSANSIASSIIPGTIMSKRPSRTQKALAKDSKKIPKNIDKKNKRGETLLHQACIKVLKIFCFYLITYITDFNWQFS